MQAPYDALRSGFLKAYMALLLIAGLVAWWVVLAHQSRRVAQDESNRQTSLLLREIELHRQTDAELQLAKQAAERANQAKQYGLYVRVLRSVHACSRTENKELLKLAIGGYGLFGVIATIKLRLAPRIRLERVVEVIGSQDLISKVR